MECSSDTRLCRDLVSSRGEGTGSSLCVCVCVRGCVCVELSGSAYVSNRTQLSS